MPRGIEPVDVLVGQRVRAYRLARGMSQSALAEKVDVTFQQIQKYENGSNRISSSRFKRISIVLGVGVAALFDAQESDQPAHDPVMNILSERYALRLLKAYGAITDARLRFALVELAERLGSASDDLRPSLPRRGGE